MKFPNRVYERIESYQNMKSKVQILRESKNLTQAELAEKSGLSLRTIQRIEAGSIPKGFTLRSLVNALEIGPENLFVNEEQSIVLNRAKLINISALSFLILPFGNIIIPAILTYKTKDPKAKELGKNILSVQLIWTVATCVSLIASPFVQLQFPTNIPLFLIILILLFCINIFIIMRNGISLHQKQDLVIKLRSSIL